MTVAIYLPLLSKSPTANFIVETFFPLFERFPAPKLFVISEGSPDQTLLLPNIEQLFVKPQPKNPLLKRLWIERSLTSLIKKAKADIFISGEDFCSLSASFPQCILIPAVEKLKPAYANKAQLLVTMSESMKKKLTGRLRVREDKIAVVYPSPNKMYLPLDTERRESIKRKYSDGKEYFLYSSDLKQEGELIDLLKSFSHFKKRQQSSFKMLLVTETDFLYEKSIETYKYRHDVIIIRPNSILEKAGITAAAYAQVFPSDTNEDIAAALNAMQSGTPVISTSNSSISEIGGDAVWYSKNEVKDMGERMMQLYKDEDLRSVLIEKGKEQVKNFSAEKSAGQLWQSLMKAMN